MRMDDLPTNSVFSMCSVCSEYWEENVRIAQYALAHGWTLWVKNEPHEWDEGGTARDWLYLVKPDGEEWGAAHCYETGDPRNLILAGQMLRGYHLDELLEDNAPPTKAEWVVHLQTGAPVVRCVPDIPANFRFRGAQ